MDTNRRPAPLCIAPGETDLFDDRFLRIATWGFVFLGLTALLLRFALRFPLRGDEAAVCSSYLTRHFVGLMRGLDNVQVAPLLHLWIQKASVTVLGFTEWSLRVQSLAFGIAALFLFRHVAGRLCRGAGFLLSVGFFASSYWMIRLGAEAKPYMGDAFVTLAMLALFVEWNADPKRARWLWGLAAFAPLALGLSFPAVFVAGALSLAIAAVVWKHRAGSSAVALIAFNFSVAASLAVYYYISIRHQSAVNLDAMRGCWGHTFPPLTEPMRLAPWLLRAMTGEYFAFPIGGKNFGSTLTLVCTIVGSVVFIRRGKGLMALVLGATIGLHLVAASIGKYPFGGNTRFSMYAGPLICLLAGVGVARMVLWTRSGGRVLGRNTVAVILVLLALLPIGSIVRDFVKPYKDFNNQRFRAFSEWFWFNQAYDAEVVCLHTDRRAVDAPPLRIDRSWSIYLCDQAIYSPRHHEGRPPRMDRIAAAHPLRCVRFVSRRCATEERAVDMWLATMQRRYRLIDQRIYRLIPLEDTGDADFRQSLVVYEFEPRRP